MGRRDGHNLFQRCVEASVKSSGYKKTPKISKFSLESIPTFAVVVTLSAISKLSPST